MLKHLFAFACLFCITFGHAQTVITGTVADSAGNALVNATLTLQDSTNNTLAFGFTNSQGIFRLVFANKLPPKTMVAASFIGYAKQEKATSLQPMKFELKASTNQLKNVFVKRTAISQRGDTVNYTVKDFVAPTDAVIADVLKRLPGVEVLESGAIKYQGKLINKFYVEGLDLLNGRYGLASNNVPANAVEQVQILENHQPIKALDSVSNSNRAAINLKLTKKARNRLIGRLKLGVGLPATLWDAEWVPMKFGNNQQTLVVYKTNNIGNVNSKEANNLLEDAASTNYTIEGMKLGLLHTTVVNNPNLQAKRYLFNKEHFVSVNHLKLLPKQYQLKLNADFITDDNTRTVTNTSNFFFIDTAINIKEILANRNRKTYLRLGAEITRNLESYYFSNKFSFTHQRLPATAFVGGAFEHNQLLASTFSALENNLFAVRTKGKTVFKYIWNTQWATTQQNLIVQPGLFADFFNGGIAFKSLEQTWRQRALSTDIAVHISKRIKAFVWEQEFELNAAIFSSIGHLTLQTANQAIVKDSFRVQQVNTQAGVFSISKLTWQKNRLSVGLHLPIKQYWFSLPVAGSANWFTAVEPMVSGTYKVNNFWFANMESGFRNTVFPLANTYNGFVLGGYRSVSNHNNIVQNSRSLFGTVGIRYRDIIKGIYMNSSFTKERNRNNWLSQQQFTQALNISQYLLFLNRLSSTRWNIDVTKYFGVIKTGVTIGVNGNSNKNPQLLGNVLQQSAFKNTQGLVKVNTLFKQFQITYLGTWNSLVTRVAKQTEQQTSLLQQQLEMQWALGKGVSVKAGYEYTNVGRNGRQQTSISMADFLVQWRWKNKIDYKLQLDNIFNTQQFTAVQAFSNQVNTNVFALRPRQCVASITFNFQ